MRGACGAPCVVRTAEVESTCVRACGWLKQRVLLVLTAVFWFHISIRCGGSHTSAYRIMLSRLELAVASSQLDAGLGCFVRA